MDTELQQIMQSLGLTEEDMAALFESGVFGERAGMLGDQMGMANQMRNTPTPEMRQAGRVQVAANPLEMLSSGLSRIAGQKQMGDLMDQRGSLIDMLKKGNQTGGLIGMRDRFGQPEQAVPPVQAPLDLQGEEADLIRRLMGR